MTPAHDEDLLDALRETARSLLEAGDRKRTSAVTWPELAELGWLEFLVPDDSTPSGGMSAAVVVSDELGYALASNRFISSAVLATTAIVVAGNDDQRARWLPGLVDGTLTATVAMTGRHGRPGSELLSTLVSPVPNGYQLDGESGFVLDPSADLLVVAANDAVHGTRLFAVDRHAPGVEISLSPALDDTRELGSVRLRHVLVRAAAELAAIPAEQAIDLIHACGTLSLAADAVGAARHALDLAASYAKQRKQFGRAIGSFQAVKHKLVDMHVLTQCASLAVASAARALDTADPDAGRRVSVCGSYAREAAAQVVGDAIQVHGGIGFTWEHPCHRLFKRVKLDEHLLGDVWSHREQLAAEVMRAASHVTRRGA